MRRLALLSVTVLAACQGSTERPRSPAPMPAASAKAQGPGLELDLSQVMATVRRAVRRDGDRLLARGDHHQLTVDAAGLARLAPLGQPRGGAPAELRLETSAVTRGGVSLLGLASARADGAAVVVSRGQVEERIVNGDGGVEQRWHLASRPSGSGDLEVGVRVAGLPFAGATAGGLHFGDPRRGAMVRYGLATWVDADGARLPLATRFAGGSIRITVPAATLEAARYPAVIDPVISVERAIDQPPGGSPASGTQVKPAVACLATGACLVVWQDQALQFYGTNTQLRAARVSGSTLAVLDPNGFDVDDASDGGDCGAPVVVAAGDEFAVVYRSLFGGSQRLMMTRVTSAGSLAGARQQVAPVAGSFSAAAGKPVAGGTPVAIAWDLNQIYFASYLKGTAVVAPRIPLDRNSLPADETARWDRPAITWTGTRWFLAWRGGIGITYPAQVIRVAFLDAAGVLQAGETNGYYIMGTAGAGYQDFFTQPVVASDGLDHVLVLTASNSAGEPYPGLVRAMRFSPSSSDSVAWSIGNIPNIWTDNSVMGLSAWWNGSSFSVLLQYQPVGGGMTAQLRGVPATPFTTAPSDPPPAGTQVSTPALFPAPSQVDSIRAVPDGVGGTLLAWEDTSNKGQEIRAGRPGGGDARTGSLLLTTGTADEGQPAVAYDGGTWLVAWEDQRTVVTGGGGDVFALRLGRTDGAPLDSPVLQLTAAPGSQGDVVAAGGGGGFLVAWGDFADQFNTNLHATRVTTAGTIQSAAGVAVAASPTRHESPLAAGFDGTNYHLLYAERDSGTPSNMLLKDVRIQPADLLRLAPVTVAPTPADPNQSLDGGLACRSDGCLVAWAEGGGTNIMARTVVGGTAGTPAPLVNAVLANARPRVSAAAAGTPAFLVAWIEQDNSLATQDIRAQLAVPAGTASGTPFTLAAGLTSQWEPPTLSFNGFDHVVAWSPNTGGLTLGWIQADGTPRASPSELVAASPDAPRNRVSTAGDGEGRTLVAWSAFDATPGVRARRVKILIASWSKLLGDPCAQASDCGSGLCVEGVCCDTACGGGLGCQTCAARNGHGIAGHCSPTTGDSCSDGNACTAGETCNASGTCAGGSTVTCSVAPLSCDLSSSCNGTATCTVVKKSDTSGCDDGNPCTYGDKCTGGVCAGTPRSCTPPACQVASACNGLNECNFTPAPDGADCEGGSCKQGACVAGPGAVLGLTCGSGPAGPEALLLALLLLAFAGRRAGRRA